MKQFEIENAIKAYRLQATEAEAKRDEAEHKAQIAQNNMDMADRRASENRIPDYLYKHIEDRHESAMREYHKASEEYEAILRVLENLENLLIAVDELEYLTK